MNITRFIIFLAAFVLAAGCVKPKPAPNPLAGWQLDFSPPRPSDKIIEKDYQDYIKSLPPQGPKVTALGHSYQDGSGQHAIMIDVFEGGTASWTYIFIYDKDNRRINAIKYRYNRYQS